MADFLKSTLLGRDEGRVKAISKRWREKQASMVRCQ